MSVDSTNFDVFLPLANTFPSQWDEARPLITEYLNKISNAINIREIGWLISKEYPTGGQLFSSVEGQFRSVLREVIDFGALPNSATKSVPHHISYDSNFSLLNLVAGASDPVGLTAIPIPFASSILTENIKLTIDNTNINITTDMNYSNYTICYVTIIYVRET